MVGLSQDEGERQVIPIVISTHNRLRYLDLLLRSLSGSDVPSGTPVIVVDDASTDGTREYLLVKGCVQRYEDRFAFPYDNPTWRRYVGDLPDVREFPGVRGKIETVASQPQLGSIRAALLAIKYTFEKYPQAQRIIRLEDDVIVSRNFTMLLAHAWNVWDNPKAGILSGFGMRPLSPVLNKRNGVAELVREGDWVGSPCYMLSRKLFEGPLRRIFRQRKPQRGLTAGADLRLCQLARNSGMVVGITMQGLVQHVGISPRARRSEPRSVRIDSTCKPPYAFADEVRNFNA